MEICVVPPAYLWNDGAATVVRAAREANEAMPGYALELREGVRHIVSAASLIGCVVDRL